MTRNGEKPAPIDITLKRFGGAAADREPDTDLRVSTKVAFMEKVMKSILMSIALIVGGTTLVLAADVKVEKKAEERPGVNVQVAPPGVGVERKERVETTGRGTGCDTKSVTREGVGESKTVTKSNC
jgi:hypothetical protein